jgi:hypothetical protein
MPTRFIRHIDPSTGELLRALNTETPDGEIYPPFGAGSAIRARARADTHPLVAVKPGLVKEPAALQAADGRINMPSCLVPALRAHAAGSSCAAIISTRR